MADLSRAIAIARSMQRPTVTRAALLVSAGDNGDAGDTSQISRLAASYAGDSLGTHGDIAWNASPLSPSVPNAQSL